MRTYRFCCEQFQTTFCVFFNNFQFLMNVRPQAKAIYKIIYIFRDPQMSKCYRFSEYIKEELAHKGHIY